MHEIVDRGVQVDPGEPVVVAGFENRFVSPHMTRFLWEAEDVGKCVWYMHQQQTRVFPRHRLTSVQKKPFGKRLVCEY